MIIETHMFDEILHRVSHRIQKSYNNFRKALEQGKYLKALYYDMTVLGYVTCAASMILTLRTYYCCIHGFLATLLLHICGISSLPQCIFINFEQSQNKHYEVVIMKLPILLLLLHCCRSWF